MPRTKSRALAEPARRGSRKPTRSPRTATRRPGQRQRLVEETRFRFVGFRLLTEIDTRTAAAPPARRRPPPAAARAPPRRRRLPIGKRPRRWRASCRSPPPPYWSKRRSRRLRRALGDVVTHVEPPRSRRSALWRPPPLGVRRRAERRSADPRFRSSRRTPKSTTPLGLSLRAANSPFQVQERRVSGRPPVATADAEERRRGGRDDTCTSILRPLAPTQAPRVRCRDVPLRARAFTGPRTSRRRREAIGVGARGGVLGADAVASRLVWRLTGEAR